MGAYVRPGEVVTGVLGYKRRTLRGVFGFEL